MPAKLNSLIPFLCFLSITSYAQKNLKEGAVVLNSMDTTKGFIDYKEWAINPSFVSFTISRDKPATRYNISEISYFEIEGLEQYQRHTISVSLDKEAVSNFSEKDTSTDTRTVFLKILQKGRNVTLFSYRDNLKRRLYILESDKTVPVELLNTVYMVNGGIKQEMQFRSGLLSLATKYLPGDGPILSQINNAGYHAGSIEKICLKLNGDTKRNTAKFTNKHRQPAFRFFIGGGINQGTLKMEGNNLFSGINSHPFYHPLVNIGGDFATNPAVGRLRIRAEIHATTYKTDAYVFKDFDQYTEEYFLKFRQVNIAVEPQVFYNLYNRQKFKWFISGGIGLNFSNYPLNEQKFMRKSSTNAEAVNENYLIALQRFWINARLGTGVDFNRLELALVYFPPASVTRTTYFGLDNSSLQLRLNYYIKR